MLANSAAKRALGYTNKCTKSRATTALAKSGNEIPSTFSLQIAQRKTLKKYEACKFELSMMNMSLADVQSFIEMHGCAPEVRGKANSRKKRWEQKQVVVNSHNKYRNEKNKARFRNGRHNIRSRKERHPL